MQTYNHTVNLLPADFTSHKSHTHTCLHQWQFSFISLPVFKSRTFQCNLITTALLIYKITLYYTNPYIRIKQCLVTSEVLSPRRYIVCFFIRRSQFKLAGVMLLDSVSTGLMANSLVHEV